jgi:alkylation response protein AidB-like acyl-CoA dehydrogenase
MIDLLLDDDQRALLEAITDFLSHELPASNEQCGGGFDRAFWERCAELGWCSLALEESAGGMGLSIAEEIILCREIGRHLMPLPYLSTLTATHLAAVVGRADLTADLAAGKLVVGLAERLRDGRTLAWSDSEVDLTLVVDIPRGEVQLVEALALDEAAIDPTIDPQVGLVQALDVPAPMVLIDAGSHAQGVIVHGAVLTAAMLTGIAEQARDDSTDYAKYRVQYGKPIGTFQAVKHRCADMALRAERAWAQTAVAALQIRAGGATAAFEGLAAKVVAADAAISNARDNIQNHGGIGFTSEHSAHRYLKRAHVLEYAFGTGREHAPQLIELQSKW